MYKNNSYNAKIARMCKHADKLVDTNCCLCITNRINARNKLNTVAISIC